jgi:hypothetical protein
VLQGAKDSSASNSWPSAMPFRKDGVLSCVSEDGVHVHDAGTARGPTAVIRGVACFAGATDFCQQGAFRGFGVCLGIKVRVRVRKLEVGPDRDRYGAALWSSDDHDFLLTIEGDRGPGEYRPWNRAVGTLIRCSSTVAVGEAVGAYDRAVLGILEFSVEDYVPCSHVRKTATATIVRKPATAEKGGCAKREEIRHVLLVVELKPWQLAVADELVLLWSSDISRTYVEHWRRV